MKTILFMLAASMMVSVVYGEEKQLRYENFVFIQNFENGSDKIKAALEQSLSEFHYIEKLSAATIEDYNLALYRVNIRKERSQDYTKKLNYKQYILKQKFDESDWVTWDAVSHIYPDGNMKVLFKSTNYNQFFSVKGRRDYDYYGCIDKKPVYTASLIEGQPDFFFIITSTQGSPVDPLVSDYMTITISSSLGELQLSEKLFWANFYPTKNGPKVHFYGESTPNLKFDELPISDGFGRKRYAKMYIADLDKDNNLDILFWFKTFKSTKYSEKKGFRFERESFKLYRENDSGKGFEEKTIDADKAIGLLKENELAWESGYPQNNSLCDGWYSQVPMMMQIVD